MPPGQWSKAALQERHAAQAYKDTLLACARDYAVGHGLGAKAALNTGLFPGIGYTLLHKTIHGTSRLAKREQGMREAWQILTDVEELALVEWIISSGRGKDPPTDEDVGRQIILMLKARKHDNKQRKHGRGTVPLTTAETRLVTEANAEVSHIWLQKFAGRHPEVSKQKERNAARASRRARAVTRTCAGSAYPRAPSSSGGPRRRRPWRRARWRASRRRARSRRVRRPSARPTTSARPRARAASRCARGRA